MIQPYCKIVLVHDLSARDRPIPSWILQSFSIGLHQSNSIDLSAIGAAANYNDSSIVFDFQTLTLSYPSLIQHLTPPSTNLLHLLQFLITH
jgi:hypothetical protein